MNSGEGVLRVEEARAAVLSHVTRLAVETVPVEAAAGRVLGEDVAAPADLWPFPRAAMDGFAVRAADVSTASADRPVTLQVIGTIRAGEAAHRPVVAGTAVRIATGAPIPDGADAVIPLEVVADEGTTVSITAPVSRGRHVFPAGEDARRGEVILAAGCVLRPGSVALLASLGIDRVAVVRRSVVAILTAGDELVEIDRAIRPGQVRESNTYALAAAVAEAGGIPRRLGIARDDLEDIVAGLRRGLDADALIVCAGMSVGERDLVKTAMARAGIRLVFWRMAMKPGAPAAFGLAGGTPVFGLPGTPGAAMVAFEELVRPALRKMMGYRDELRPVLQGRLTAPLAIAPGRRRYLWAKAVVSEGQIRVRPLQGQGTAALRSVSDANALIMVEPHQGPLQPGDLVSVQMLADPEMRGGERSAPLVVSVVGAKGAGKTYVIERLVPELRRRGYRVAVLKHDVHGFEIDREGTDTWRIARAGAEIVAIVGPDRQAVLRPVSGEPPLGEILSRLDGVDLIVLEGYSQAAYPKIEVRRRGVVTDKPPPAGPVLAVVTDEARGESDLSFSDIPVLADRLAAMLRHPRAMLCSPPGT
ncbi:MAG: molybdopterin-guanine dinucleotide biosynthesis protein B [Armatimonadota bacterium]|nr:molybdopterin-guanine dinucleotide biosynthesis protein B [Armatimonadota bacterium]